MVSSVYEVTNVGHAMRSSFDHFILEIECKRATFDERRDQCIDVARIKLARVFRASSMERFTAPMIVYANPPGDSTVSPALVRS